MSSPVRANKNNDHASDTDFASIEEADESDPGEPEAVDVRELEEPRSRPSTVGSNPSPKPSSPTKANVRQGTPLKKVSSSARKSQLPNKRSAQKQGKYEPWKTCSTIDTSLLQHPSNAPAPPRPFQVMRAPLLRRHLAKSLDEAVRRVLDRQSSTATSVNNHIDVDTAQ